MRTVFAGYGGRRPPLGAGDPGGHVVADEHAPQPLAVGEPDGQAGGHMRVLHVFAVDRRDTAKRAVRQVERHEIVQPGMSQQRHRLVAPIRDRAHSLAQV